MYLSSKLTTTTTKKADIRFRLRVFSYLKTNGQSTMRANQIAHKVTTAMVSPGILSLAAKKIAAAAISAPSNYDIKYLGLLEPKAEPFEYSGTATMIGKQGNQQPTDNPPPQKPQGSVTNWAMIEPVTTRREVSNMIGTSLSGAQLQTHVGMIAVSK